MTCEEVLLVVEATTLKPRDLGEGACAWHALALSVCALAACAPQRPPAVPEVKRVSATAAGGSTAPASSTAHDHAASCWIDGSGASQDSDIDLMLFVVGLNHSMPPRNVNWGVDQTGVRELADTIHAVWPHPESVVVMGSSFPNDCAPTSGACLKKELAARYKASFELHEEPWWDNDAAGGTIGVLSGSRWAQQGSQRQTVASNPLAGISLVYLKDAVTGFTLGTYAFHTNGGDAALEEILPTARAAKTSIQRSGRIAPILAGDFNLVAESGVKDGITDVSRATLRDNFLWANFDAACTGVAGLPDGVFRAQNGNMMQALLGRLSASDSAFSYACASAVLEPVRFSYSVDSTGRLAVRPPDGRPAFREGIVLNTIAHNVLAIGLKLKMRTTPECDCKCDEPLPDRAACGGRDECGNLCRCQSTHCGKPSNRCVRIDESCEAKCEAAQATCIGRCTGRNDTPSCKSQCGKAHEKCVTAC